MIEGTLSGGFHMSQLVARHMVERGAAGARSCSSRAAMFKTPYARSVAYNAGKAGLNHMAFTIAAELVPPSDQRQRDRAGLDRHARRARSIRRRGDRKGRPDPSLGPSRDAPKTSARPPCSSPPTTPTTSPGPPCASTAESYFSTLTNKHFKPFRRAGLKT